MCSNAPATHCRVDSAVSAQHFSTGTAPTTASAIHLPGFETDKDEIMFKSKLKTTLFGSLLALAVISAPSQATNIRIGVAANFYATLQKITAAYTLAHPGETFTISWDSTSNLKTNIVAGGNAGPYDLFLSADKSTPDSLVTSNPGIVIAPDFKYAIGSLILWSNTAGVNLSAGLPNPLNVDFVIADPTKAPYGSAATQILSSVPWSIPLTTTYPTGHVKMQPNIVATYNAVAAKTYPYGFVHLSAVCSKNLTTGVQTITAPSATSYKQYLYNDAAHPYSQILQYGLKINITGRTAAQTTQLNNFVTFLTTNTTATNYIKGACYGL